MIYLDNSSTTKQAKEVTEEMVRAFEEDFGNPSSLHELGRTSQNKINDVRKRIAQEIGSDEYDIFFTSGGTESDNMAVFGAAEAKKREGKRIITTKIEHPAILQPCKRLEKAGFDIVYLDVDEKGLPDLKQYEEALKSDVALVSVMAVNNEIGTVLPIRDMADMAHSKGALFHTDAVQGFGKIGMKGCAADFISISGHKIHGPKGVGVLAVKKEAKFAPYILGGGQEKGMRSGTENVSGIAGLGKAVEMAYDGMEHIAQLKGKLLEGFKAEIPDIKVNGSEEDNIAVGSILNISFMGTRGEVLLHTLEAEGIYVSTGSACSSNKKGKSHVLSAIGCTDREIESAVRFSLSRYNKIEEIEETVEKTAAAVKRFRRLGSFR
ncbi:MAG: cysteine desulfurase family protein [Hornefia sp.]|nr:cysteine desulfurase family protein [Hornefia sp.]